MLKWQMPNLRYVGGCVKYNTASPAGPRHVDLELASKHYGSSRIRHALSEYARAEGGSVREDFFWEPEHPRLVTWPIDLSSRKAELFAVKNFFAPDNSFFAIILGRDLLRFFLRGTDEEYKPGIFPSGLFRTDWMCSPGRQGRRICRLMGQRRSHPSV